MKFMNLVDATGKQHSVNPFDVAALRQDDAGCVVIRGTGDPPILLNETVEVMCDALSSHGVSAEKIAAANWTGRRNT
jgi:hypothetical protein